MSISYDVVLVAGEGDHSNVHLACYLLLLSDASTPVWALVTERATFDPANPLKRTWLGVREPTGKSLGPFAYRIPEGIEFHGMSEVHDRLRAEFKAEHFEPLSNDPLSPRSLRYKNDPDDDMWPSDH